MGRATGQNETAHRCHPKKKPTHDQSSGDTARQLRQEMLSAQESSAAREQVQERALFGTWGQATNEGVRVKRTAALGGDACGSEI